jgi:hypothetical protein
MTLPTSGTISLLALRNEFGDVAAGPISLNEFYRGGPNVAGNVTAGTGSFQTLPMTVNAGPIVVPASGTIQLSHFFGVSAVSYSILSPTGPASVNEGAQINIIVNTTGVPNGTVLFWSTIGTVSAADFVGSALTGAAPAIAAGSCTIARTLASDITTEGPETFQLQIRTGSVGGPVVATTGLITVNDTSLSPSYSISASTTSVDEGTPVTFTVNTQNVALTTSINWQMFSVSPGVNGFDFVPAGTVGPLPPLSGQSGTVTITAGSFANGSGTFQVLFTADLATEGAESFAVGLVTGGGVPLQNALGNQAISALITVNDTSTPSATTGGFYSVSSTNIFGNVSGALNSVSAFVDFIPNGNVQTESSYITNGSPGPTVIETFENADGWFNPTTAGIGLSYWMLVTLASEFNSGNDYYLGVTQGVWTQLDIARALGLSENNSPFGNATAEYLVQISTTAGPAGIVGAHTVRIAINQEP